MIGGTWKACALAALAAAACSSGGPAKGLLAKEPEGARCKIKGVQKSPWIVTLPAENSVDLDTRLADTDGLVAVRYRGCEMEVLTRCKIAGRYRWQPANLAANSFVIENSDELYAKMPIGAASIEGHLTRDDALRVSYTLSGRYAADRPTVAYEELQQLGAECATATHLVVGALGGAYDFESVRRAAVGGKAGPFAHGDSKARRAVLNSRGKAGACGGGAAGETRPPHNCGAPLKIELAEVVCPTDMHFEQEQGCVAGRGTDGSGRDIIVNARPEERPFAALVVEATQLAFNAARGKPIPAAWTTPALLESQAEVMTETAKVKTLGLVATAARVEVRGVGADGKPAGVRLEVLVWPDGRLKWASFRESWGDEPMTGHDTPALGPLKDHLVGALFAGGSCKLDVVNEADVASVPVPDDQRDEFKRNIEEARAELPKTCERLRAASGPYTIAFDRIDIAYSSEVGIRVLSANLESVGGVPQLGRLDFRGM